MLEPALFLLALLMGPLMGGVVGGMLSETYFGIDSSNERLFTVAGAAGGVVLALGIAWGIVLPAADLPPAEPEAFGQPIATVQR
jgi:hypothetical protein